VAALSPAMVAATAPPTQQAASAVSPAAVPAPA
jgi:hypothetical protein